MKTREYWLDYSRAFACILVTIGHLLMSFQDSSIVNDAPFLTIFIQFLYSFHVFIFFFCSGYLFQKSKPFPSKSEAFLSKLEKCFNFLILYVLFSGITYVIKFIFSSDVNTSIEHSFFDVLIKHPINQMWYLYAISIIFFFAYSINSKRSFAFILSVACILKIIICIPETSSLIPVPFNYFFDNFVWFVIGQIFAYKQFALNKEKSILTTFLFVSLFTVSLFFDLKSEFIDAAITFLGIIASISVIYLLTKEKTSINGVWKYVSKYMLQIYLLHTICAAGIRIILLKLDVTQLIPHLVFGIIFSFMIPILCAIIAERIEILNIFFFPIPTFKKLFLKNKN